MGSEDNQKLPWESEKQFYEMHCDVLFPKYGFYHVGMIGRTDAEFLSYVCGRLNLNAESVLVDLGCGSGYLVGHVSALCEAVGLSTSPKLVDGCRERYPDASFLVGNMESYVHEGATHIVSMESLGYADLEKTLCSISESLEPDGIFYLKDLFRLDWEESRQMANREHWERYWNYKGRLVEEVIVAARAHHLVLSELKDVTRLINPERMFESMSLNSAPYVLPFPDVNNYLRSVELVFIKK